MKNTVGLQQQADYSLVLLLKREYWPPKLWELWKTRSAFFAESFPSEVGTVENLLFGFSTVSTERQFPQLLLELRILEQ